VALDDEEQPMAMAMAMAVAVAPRPSSWHSLQQGFSALEQSFVGASIEVLLELDKRMICLYIYY